MRFETLDLTRRQWLGLAAGAATATTLGPNHGEATTAGPQPARAQTPAALRQMYRRMRFARHEQPLFWWIRAVKYGLVEQKLLPLYLMEVGTIMRCRNGSVPGRFSVTSLELVYNLDLSSGALLETWLNPYTNETIRMRPPAPLGPTRIDWTESGPQLPTELPGARLEHEYRTTPPVLERDDVFLGDESYTIATFPGTDARPFHVNDASAYHASHRELDDARRDSVACTVSFDAYSSWQRWMNMGDRPGSLISRGSGRKVDQMAQMPANFQALAQRLHPEIHRDPAGALDRPAARFER